MIRRLGIACLARPPFWNFLRWRALRGGHLTILCYHTLGPDAGGTDGWTVLARSEFRAQLKALQRTYRIVSLDEALLGPDPHGRPQAVITFDDGDRGLYTYLLPILRETPVPVTIYVATAQFETGRPFWFDRVVNALQGGHDISVNGLGSWVLPTRSGKAHWAVLSDILEALKGANPVDREGLADQVVAQGSHPSDPKTALGPMTRDQLKELAALDDVTIGAHSHGHELLDQIPLSDARQSMARSQELLREWTGQSVHHFAFPNGNHTSALRQAAKDIGFRTATILEDQPAAPDSDPFALPRISVGRYDSHDRVRLRLVGI